MSFDLALNKGDLSVGSDGDLSKTRNTSKIVQDILKVLHTPVGSNPYFPSLGNTLTSANIGQNINKQFAETKVASVITQSIQTLQAMQRNQTASGQTVTPEETIVAIQQVTAEQDPTEPRQYNITVIVQTQAIDALQLPSFSLSTTILG